MTMRASMNKCTQRTMNITGNLFKKQWTSQQMYSKMMTANVFKEYDSKYSMNNDYDSKYIQWIWEQVYSMNNDYDNKCIQLSLNMAANAYKQQWPWQQMYWINNIHNSKCLQESLNIKANVLNKHEYHSKCFDGQWISQQIYSTTMKVAADKSTQQCIW